jgi:hypothetical protein
VSVRPAAPAAATGGWPGVSTGGNGSSPKKPESPAEKNPAVPPEPEPPTEPVVKFDPNAPSRRLTVVLTPTGDRERDKAKLVRAHAILRAYQGNDRFDFMLYENNQQYQLDFPNQPTNICDDMLITLKLLVGEENITIHETA